MSNPLSNCSECKKMIMGNTPSGLCGNCLEIERSDQVIRLKAEVERLKTKVERLREVIRITHKEVEGE